MIIATAGHIDHGKTTLVRALTGVDTDRLPEEKARGISIDIGFAHCTLDGRTIGFVDVPGHERFVRNMLSGVYAVDHVLLVVAADDGVMPQTREHLRIVDLLGVSQATVVVTKMDRADASRTEEVRSDSAELLRDTKLQGSPVLAVSAVTGEGMPALRDRIAAVASRQHASNAGSGVLTRFVVDRSFTAMGSGTVVTGTVIAGTVREGDSLVITPAGTHARVRKLERHGVATGQAVAGERCAINLANVERSAVGRGDWLVAPEAHHRTDRLDVRLKVLASEAAPLKHETPVHLHIGAADIPARVLLRRGLSVPPGEEQIAQLRLQRPIHAAHGDRLILRDQSAVRTIGGGVVVDPFPLPQRRSRRAAVLGALDQPEARGSLEAVLRVSPDGVQLEWFAKVFNLSLATVSGLLPADAVVVAHAGTHTAFSASEAGRLQTAIVDRVRRFHAEHGNVAGMELVDLHSDVARMVPGEAFQVFVKQCAQRAGLQFTGSRVSAAGHDSTENPRDLLAWQRIRPLLQNAGALIPSVREVSAQTGLPLHQVRDLMHRKGAQGQLLKLTPERFALPDTVEMLRMKAEQLSAGRPEGLFSAAQYRDVIGTGRGLAIEILEYLDKRGDTQRRGDLRTLGDRRMKEIR